MHGREYFFLNIMSTKMNSASVRLNDIFLKIAFKYPLVFSLLLCFCIVLHRQPWRFLRFLPMDSNHWLLPQQPGVCHAMSHRLSNIVVCCSLHLSICCSKYIAAAPAAFAVQSIAAVAPAAFDLDFGPWPIHRCFFGCVKGQSHGHFYFCCVINLRYLDLWFTKKRLL